MRSMNARLMLSLVLALAGAILLGVSLTRAATAFYQGFEVDNSGWNLLPGPATATRVPTGTHNVPSFAGGFHAEASQCDLDVCGGSAFTNWGGYETSFPDGGYTTTLAIFLDLRGPNSNMTVTHPDGSDTRFDFSSAINDSAGNLLQDLVFNAGFYTPAGALAAGCPASAVNVYYVAASTSAGRSRTNPCNPAGEPVALTSTDWYTFVHRFYLNNGVPSVDMSIFNSTGLHIMTWTQPIAIAAGSSGAVGGHRYGWFASSEFRYLPFDETRLASGRGQCDAGGWRYFVNPSFQSEGDCLRSFQHLGGSTPPPPTIACTPGSGATIPLGSMVQCSFSAADPSEQLIGWTTVNFTPMSSTNPAPTFTAAGLGKGVVQVFWSATDGTHSEAFRYRIGPGLSPTQPFLPFFPFQPLQPLQPFP